MDDGRFLALKRVESEALRGAVSGPLTSEFLLQIKRSVSRIENAE